MVLFLRMSSVIRLMIVEADPVLRTGLVNCLNRATTLQTTLQIVGEVDAIAPAWRILSDPDRRADIDLILTSFGLAFCQALKEQYPTVPILLVGNPSDAELLPLFQLGVEGFCPSGTAIATLMTAIQTVAAGQSYWQTQPRQAEPVPLRTVLRKRWSTSGLRQIEAALQDIHAQLQNPRLSAIDKAFLAGRRRELRAARWFVQQLNPAEPLRPQIAPTNALVVTSPAEIEPTDSAPNPRTIQAELFDRIASKLQSNLENLTNTPLEIDILRVEKKRELFYTVLRQLEESLDELRFSQVPSAHLYEKQVVILRDLWNAIATHFFGKYYTLRIKNRDVEVVPTLLEEIDRVEAQILNKIPLVPEIFAHLIHQAPLTIEQTDYPVGTLEASDRATDILENLIIQLANAAIQPLLNRFANVEAIKQGLYDRRLLSTREIERFRNDLSWQYRVNRFVGDPTAMFESRYRLRVFSDYGIEQIAVYAPRTEELDQLAGVQLAVTLALETRDAIAPRLRSTLDFLGSGVVYFLTEVLGRGIGLIGRGILKGIGKSIKS
jgi:DNA-binding NarL/FixJ family response regulator